LILKESYVVIIISSFIAVPFAAVWLGEWMQNFAFRIDLDLWIFVVPVLAAFFFATATTILQIFQTARVNSARTLRTE